MATNVTTLVLYIPAMRAVALSTAAVSSKVAVVVVAMIVTTLPATLPLAAYVVAPGPASNQLGRLHRFLQRHQHHVIAVVCFGFAVFLDLKGFAKV
jgi:hypothetical protein